MRADPDHVNAAELAPILNRWVEQGGLISSLTAAQQRRAFDIRTGKVQLVGVDVAERLLLAIGEEHQLNALLPPLDDDGPWNGEEAWCPTCRERCSCNVGRPCAWCDTPTVKRRGGWKRPDRQRFTRQQAEAIAAVHASGVSLRAISRAMYQKHGYKTPQSCLETIRLTLKRDGLAVRPRAAATAANNRARRVRRPDETAQDYKRRMRRERGYRDSRSGAWKVAA